MMIGDMASLHFEIPSLNESLWKVTLLIVVGWLAHFILSKQNPRWRILLWRSVVCGIAAIPLLIGIVPEYEIAMPVIGAIQKPIQHITKKPENSSTTDKTITPSQFDEIHRSFHINQQTETTTILMSQSMTPELDQAERWNIKSIFFMWGIITFLLIMRIFRGASWVRKIIKKSTSGPEWMQQSIQRAAKEMGCSQQPLLRCSTQVSAPYLCGFIHPVILLPERMIQEDYQKELPGIIAHELAHLKSKDIWWMAVIQWLQTFLWFHPLVWRINAVHDAACEAVSDAAAANYIGNIKFYSKTLARVALQIADIQPIYGGITMTRKSVIRRRLEFLKNRNNVSPLLRNRVVMFLFMAFLGLVCITGFHPLLLIGEELGDNNVIGDPTSIEQLSGSKKMPFNASATLRQINCYTPDYDWFVGKKLLFEDGAISEDGRYLAFTDHGDYIASTPQPGDKLGILDIKTNEMYAVIDISSIGNTSKPLLSPNNQLIAYRVVDSTSYQLWIGNKESGDHSKVVEKVHSDSTGVYPFLGIMGWSANNNMIYTYGAKQKKEKENEYQTLFGMVPLDTRKYESLRTVDQVLQFPVNVCLSPNRQFIAFDTYHNLQEREKPGNDIYIVDLKSSYETMVVEHSASDHVLGWSHDGKWLLFKSDRLGTWDLWGLPMDQGVPQRAPIRIKNNIGDIQCLGISSSNNLYFKNEFGTKELYLADFNMDTGISFESMIPLGQGLNEPMLSWHSISVDGKYVAFHSMELGVRVKKTYVQSLETMEIKEIKHDLVNPYWLTWSKDNKTIYATAWKRGEGGGICCINLENGEHQFIKKNDNNISYHQIYSDDQYIYFVVNLKDQTLPSIIQYNPATEAEKEILSNTNAIFHNISPNGKYISQVYKDKIQILTIEDGKIINEWNVLQSRGGMRWFPDNEHFIYLIEHIESYNDRQLLLYSIHEKEPKVIQTFDAPLHWAKFLPDGNKIILEFGDNLIQEFWVMENFLPEE